MGLTLDELKINEQTYMVNDIELMIADDVLPFIRDGRIEYINTPAKKSFAILPARGKRC